MPSGIPFFWMSKINRAKNKQTLSGKKMNLYGYLIMFGTNIRPF
jgi:hypothetical protein